MEENHQRNMLNFIQFHMALLLELETQIIISKELSFTLLGNFGKVDLLLEEVSRMLNSIISQMRQLIARR